MDWSFGPRIFVETGTFRGNQAALALLQFDHVYTIELDLELYNHCKRRFHGEPRITLLHGDSADLLPVICTAVLEPCVFYLDAHWYGKGPETPLPLLKELRAIGSRSYKDVVVIDDMRLMGKKSWSGEDGTDWPRAEFDFREATLEAISEACPGRQEMAEGIDRLIIYR